MYDQMSFFWFRQLEQYFTGKTRTVRGSDYSPATALSEDKDIFRCRYLFEKLMAPNNPDVDLVNDNVYTKFD